MKRFVSLALSAALLGWGVVSLVSIAGEPDPVRQACEPGTNLDLRARVLDIVDRGDSVRAIIEVTLDTTLEIRSARIRGNGVTRVTSAVDGRLSRRMDGSLAGLRDTGRRAPARVTRFPIDLAKGKVHQLSFEAEIEPATGEPRTARAHVTVNLDPEQQAERLPGLVQYRARSSR